MEIALGIAMLVLAAVLVVCVMLQSGKDKQLSGSIAGVTESFLGKDRAKKTDKILNRATIVCGILFVILDVVMYIFVING